MAALALQPCTPRPTIDLLRSHSRWESVLARSRILGSTEAGHALPFAGRLLAADHAPSTSSVLSSLLPHLDIAPRRTESALEDSAGAKPR